MRNKKEEVPFIRCYSGTYAYHTRMRRRKTLQRAARVLVFVLFLVLGYFLMEVLLQISMLSPV